MLDNIACLKINGSGIVFGDRYVLDNIAITASVMLQKNQKKAQIKNEQFDGLMTTEMKVGIMGATCGYIFKVELETNETGRASMSFILNRPLDEEEIRNGAWIMQDLSAEQEKAQWN